MASGPNKKDAEQCGHLLIPEDYAKRFKSFA
jgi:hypothetical protein